MSKAAPDYPGILVAAKEIAAREAQQSPKPIELPQPTTNPVRWSVGSNHDEESGKWVVRLVMIPTANGRPMFSEAHSSDPLPEGISADDVVSIAQAMCDIYDADKQRLRRESAAAHAEVDRLRELLGLSGRP